MDLGQGHLGLFDAGALFLQRHPRRRHSFGGRRLRSGDKNRQTIWSFPFKTQNNLNIADVVVSNGDVFMSAGYSHGGVMARIVGTNTTQVWANQTFANHINSSVLLDGYLYGVGGMVNGGRRSGCHVAVR